MAKILTFGEPMGLFVADEPGPLKDVSHFTRYVCGAEVNVAIGMARLGHRPVYVSRVGCDPIGEHIRDFLAESHVDTRYLWADEHHLTGMQLKEQAQGGDPFVANFRQGTAFSHFDPADLAHIDWQSVDWLHLTGIPAALSTSCQMAVGRLMDLAHEHGVTVSFDPNLRPALWPDRREMVQTINRLAAKADLVLPGIAEGEVLMGSREPEAIADFYLAQGVSRVVVKVGARGAFVKGREEEARMVPGFHVERVVDTVGAGDGFAVGLVSALLEGESLPQAARRGTAIGALAVMSAGDNEGLPGRRRLIAFMASQSWQP